VKAGLPSAGDAAPILAGLGVAYAMKAFGSRASAEELDALLAPTAWGVELLSGHAFAREAGAGYVNLDLGVAIAPACSGVNFLVIAFLTLLVGFSSRCEGAPRKLAWFGASAALAFAATLVVNTLRITLSLAERELGPWGSLSAAATHRGVGVIVYLGCLLALYATVDRLFRREALRRANPAVPLVVYLGVTLLVPLLRGAWVRPEYATHASFVLLVAAVAWSLLALRRWVSPRRGAVGHAASQPSTP
jgi:exosortase K